MTTERLEIGRIGRPHGVRGDVMVTLTSNLEARVAVGTTWWVGDREMTVEPLSNYFVGRARREMHDGRTFVGGIVSAVNRRLDTDVLAATLRKSAYAGGVDFRHELGDRTWVIQGDAEASRIAGTTSAMVLVQEQPKNYSESQFDFELALTDVSDPKFDDVVVIPTDLLARGQPIQHPKLPFRIVPKAV